MPYNNGVGLSFKVGDAKTPQKTSNFTINFPSSADIPLVGSYSPYDVSNAPASDGFASSTAALLKPLITGQIVGARISINVNLTGATLKSTPVSGADREEGALFTFRSTIGAPTKMRIPTFLEQYGLLTGTAVDTNDPDVNAFVQRVIQGDTQGATTVRYSDSRGNNVASLVKAVDSFKKYKRR